MTIAVEEPRGSCCYVLFEDRSLAQVAGLLGGRLSGPPRPARAAAQLTAAWPAVGLAERGWTVLIDPHFEFGDAEDELREWSRGTRVACLQAIERELFSQVLMWVDGTLTWQVSFDGELDGRPSVDGALPFDPDVLARSLGPANDPRTWYRLPAAAVALLTSWQPGQPEHHDEPSFKEVVYPRPVGVAAAVARDLAEHRDTTDSADGDHPGHE